jgi:hypothetical protein
MTRHPSAARREAMALPMPDEAPVTIAQRAPPTSPLLSATSLIAALE